MITNLAAVLKLCAWLMGHLAIWCAIYNQLHATALSRSFRKLAEKLIYAIVFAVGLTIVVVTIQGRGPVWNDSAAGPIARWYMWLCGVAAVGVALRWTWRRAMKRAPSRLVSERSQEIDWDTEFERPPTYGWQSSLLGRIPGNQIFKLRLETKVLAMPGLPRESDGLRIAHVSDLHFSGKIGIEFFQRVAELCNREEPDLVMVTGDIVDSAECVGWLGPTLGRLRSKRGGFYVLGNHDRQVKDNGRLRREIEATGFQCLNGRWLELAIAGGSLWLCGNELPWFAGAETLAIDPPNPLPAPRILLSHSPDQYRWALERRIDLMLAGHCHGGQIRIPGIGPLIAPSRHGVRFASGLFELGDLTLHVSRGVSSDDPIRLNCPPELAILELRSSGRGH